MRRLAQQGGATLLEVMVALGIVATAYVALIGTQSQSIRLSTYSKQITIAAFLAQSKLEEWEEIIDKEGFPDLDREETDNFEELGYPGYEWLIRIQKVELPVAAVFDNLLASWGGGEGEQGSSGGMLGQQLGLAGGSLPGQTGSLTGGASALLNPEVLRSSADMLSKMLEEAIREVRLAVWWGEGREDEQLVLTTHLVRVPQASSAAGAAPPRDLTRSGGALSPMQPPGGMQTPLQPMPTLPRVTK